MVKQAGGCLCGAVRYRVSAHPNHVVICFCRFCQKATGSDHMVEPLFDVSEFEITKGEPSVFTLISEGSGKPVHVHFCPTCGTKLRLTFDRFPTSTGVYAGTFDNPGWFERSPENTDYFFVSAAPPGAMVPAGFPRFPEHGNNLDGSAREPEILDHHLLIGLPGSA
jgi:hypothetical protein